MTNDNLPPERPLSDQARAQRKADLMREISQGARGGRRWLVPAIAAAAVVAVVAVGGAVLANGDDPQPRPVEPAGSGPAEPPVDPDTHTQDPAETPSEIRSELPRGNSGEVEFPTDPRVPCADLQIPVPGAAEIASIPIQETTVRLYGNDDTWIVCDEWAALDGGDATLLRAHEFGDPLGEDELGISQNFSMKSELLGEYVAGGALPDDVAAITYTFSDGHVEEAALADGMWAMAYFTDGERSLSGADVEVTLADGSTEQFSLRSPKDFCTQSNHGC